MHFMQKSSFKIQLFLTCFIKLMSLYSEIQTVSLECSCFALQLKHLPTQNAFHILVYRPCLPGSLAEPSQALSEAGELRLLLDDGGHPHHLPPPALLDHEDTVQPEGQGGVHTRGQGEAPELLHLGEQCDHPGVLPQAVDHQLVHPGGAGGQPRDREVVWARDLLARILSRQRGLGLLPLLLEGPELLVALLQAEVELHCGPRPRLRHPRDGGREHRGQKWERPEEVSGRVRGLAGGRHIQVNRRELARGSRRRDLVHEAHHLLETEAGNIRG